MSLVEHAQFELEKAGLFNEESDYGGMLGDAALELIKTFSKQGHSGFSAMQTLRIFNKLAHFKSLTALTDDPKEWNKYEDSSWQNKRQPSCFSTDEGKTYYDLDDKDRQIYKTEKI